MLAMMAAEVPLISGPFDVVSHHGVAQPQFHPDVRQYHCPHGYQTVCQDPGLHGPDHWERDVGDPHTLNDWLAPLKNMTWRYPDPPGYDHADGHEV